MCYGLYAAERQKRPSQDFLKIRSLVCTGHLGRCQVMMKQRAEAEAGACGPVNGKSELSEPSARVKHRHIQSQKLQKTTRHDRNLAASSPGNSDYARQGRDSGTIQRLLSLELHATHCVSERPDKTAELDGATSRCKLEEECWRQRVRKPR